MSQANTELVDQAVRTVIEDARDAFLVLDKEGRIHFLNRKIVKLTGKSEKDLLGTHFENIVDVGEKKDVAIQDVLASEEKMLRARIKTSQDDIAAEIHVKPIEADGEPVGALLIIKGRARGSEYLTALEALGSIIQRHSSSQKIYETLGENLAALHIDLMALSNNRQFTVEYHTLDSKKKRFIEFFMGISLSEIHFAIDQDVLEKLKKQQSFFFYDLLSVLESASSQFPTAQLHKFFSIVGSVQGIAVPVVCDEELTGVLILLSEELTSEDVPVISALGVHVSAALERASHFEQLVTDLKALEEQITARTGELEKIRNQMETIVQSSVDAIVATDLDGKVTFANKGVKTMLGCSEADILGSPITKYYAGGKKEARGLRTQVLKQGSIENAELSFRTEDGRLVQTLASFSLLRDEKKKVTGIMAVIRDVTEQKRLEQTLESLNKAAVKIQKSRTREQIFTVTAEELKKFDFYVVFMLFNEEKEAAKIVHLTTGKLWGDLGLELEKKEEKRPEKEKEKEKESATTNNNNSLYEVPLNNPVYRTLIKKKEAVYIQDLQTTMKLVTPPHKRNMCEKAIDLLDMPNKKSIMAPLVIHGEAVGGLSVISDVITPSDIPSIMAFANQVSTALENARLLEESQNRADELVRNLEEQQLLRELNTRLFLAQSQSEVLDAAIEGIFTLGKPFSSISMLNKERTLARPVRLEMEPRFLKMVDTIGKAVVPGFSLWEYVIPVSEEGNVYHRFFENQIPLISSNIKVHSEPVMKAELSDLYAGFAGKESVMQKIIKTASKMLPYKSMMVFPVVVEGQTKGCLSVVSNNIFSEKDFAIMSTVGEMVSSAMQRIIHSEKLAETLSELRAVQRINTLLNMGAPLEQILSQISASIEEVYNYQFAYPLLLDSSKRFLSFSHVEAPPEIAGKMHEILGTNLEEFTYPVTEDMGFYNQVILEKKCLIREGFEELAKEIPIPELKDGMVELASDLSMALGFEPGESSIMLAPLPYGEQVIGVLLLGHRKALTEEDFNRLEYFLDQVGIAMAKSEVEHRLRQSLEELRELDQMKSEFIDIASHELRTPLTTLKLYLEMMAMEQYGKLSDSLKERIQVMEEGVTRLEDIINQTLVTSRLIKNKLTLNQDPVSLLDISTEVVRQLRPLWKAKHQNIFVESVPSLSKAVGDKKALFTVLHNLVDNAVRYSPENTEILIKFAEHGDWVECRVVDQGCGIPPEHIDKVFDEFYIVPSETEYARMDGRTGLGLFIAKGIVERHHGKIWVESTCGEGSSFHVLLPKEKSAEEAA